MWIGEWLLTAQRVAVHGPSATAVIADVHLGYAEARQRRGDALPRTSVEELGPLAGVLARQQVQRLLVAGDLFEEGCRPELLEELLAWLRRYQVRLELVPGNHDKVKKETDPVLAFCRAEVEVGGWRVQHGDTALPAIPVLHGHVHPAVRHRRWVWPCYLLGPGRFLLPAYSAEAAGVNVLRQPKWCGYRCWVIAEGEVRELGMLQARGAASARRWLATPAG